MLFVFPVSDWAVSLAASHKSGSTICGRASCGGSFRCWNGTSPAWRNPSRVSLDGGRESSLLMISAACESKLRNTLTPLAATGLVLAAGLRVSAETIGEKTKVLTPVKRLPISLHLFVSSLLLHPVDHVTCLPITRAHSSRRGR